jgi:hypothetical protein
MAACTDAMPVDVERMAIGTFQFAGIAPIAISNGCAIGTRVRQLR